MKICFVVPGFSADESDWCIPAHTDIVRALAESNEVHVFTMRYPHRIDNYRIGNAFVHSFNGVGSRGASSGRLWRTVLQAVGREHKCGRFDVVHAIFGSEAGCVALLAGKWLGVQSFVWMVNGELVGLPDIRYGADLHTRQRWMNELILRFVGRVLFGCEGMANAARRRVAASRRDKIEMLPLGVNLVRFPPRMQQGENGHEPHFINVGSLVAVKDQAALLRAFAQVLIKLRGARLTIVGEGPLQGELLELASNLKIQPSVTFAGNVPHGNLATYYQRADVFVQSSRHEGQGMAMLEAAACGAAVAGSNVGALADLARGGGAVAVLGSGTSSESASRETDSSGGVRSIELASTMIKAYSERFELRARASRIIECEYNLEQIRARVEKMYTDARGRTDASFGPDFPRA